MPPENREWTIYGLLDPRDETVRYVGATSKLNSRYKAHIREGVKPLSRKQWLTELGNSGFEPELLTLEVVVGTDWGAAEKRWIEKFRAEGIHLTNIASGGPGQAGVPKSEAQRQAMSLRYRGRVYSPESRARMKAAFRDRTPEYFAKNAAFLRERAKLPISAETRAKMSLAKKGKPQSPELRAKRAAAMKGKPWSANRHAAEILLKQLGQGKYQRSKLSSCA